jgi:membrane-bound inhibitor of C-type lysozyme
MAINLKQLLAAGAVALAAAGLCAPAFASDVHTTHPKATSVLKAKTKAKHKTAKQADEQPAAADEPESTIADSVAVNYSCELNNKVVIYTNDKDDTHISLRWQNHLHRMDRVGTTTGAQRFENQDLGLIWIGIPAKGILLDSKHNHQLANECKTAEQAHGMIAAAVTGERKS